MSIAPTEKQIAYAEAIANELGIEFPTCSKDFTKYTYSKFISKYKKDYDEIMVNGILDEDYCMEICQNDIWCDYY
jgi:hypothetical protein